MECTDGWLYGGSGGKQEEVSWLVTVLQKWKLNWPRGTLSWQLFSHSHSPNSSIRFRTPEAKLPINLIRASERASFPCEWVCSSSALRQQPKMEYVFTIYFHPKSKCLNEWVRVGGLCLFVVVYLSALLFFLLLLEWKWWWWLKKWTKQGLLPARKNLLLLWKTNIILLFFFPSSSQVLAIITILMLICLSRN